uniref:Leishmanolysin-like peptidase n=1 Tax=Trichuris muris TaxID=70415 RepID=A0A5S6QPT6_TRIMR
MDDKVYVLMLSLSYWLSIHCSYALKIQLVYTLGLSREMSRDLQDVQDIVGTATKFLSDAITVKYSQPFKLEDDCNLMKTHILNTSFAVKENTDLLVVVTEPEEKGKVIVGTDICQIEGGRPVVLRMQLSRSFGFKGTARSQSLNWILHAYLHGLAFHDKLIGKFVHSGRNYKYYIDNNIRRLVQNHTGCLTLEGARIQEKNLLKPRWERVECLSAAVHWEKFAHWDDVMSYPPGPELTILTTETLNSLGHFYMKSGAPMKWGKNAPCSFLNGGCRTANLATAKKPLQTYPLCNWEDYKEDEKIYTCDEWNTRLLKCNWEKSGGDDKPFLFSNRKESFRGKEFDGKGLAGAEQMFGYCPLWMDAYDEKTNIAYHCSNQSLQPKVDANKLLQVYGPNSICMKQEAAEAITCDENNILKRAKISRFGAGCYEYKCENGRLQVRAYSPASVDSSGKFMQQWKVCWAEGSKVNFERTTNPGKNPETYRISAICPSCKAICEDSPFHKNFTCLRDLPFVFSRDKTGKACSGCSYRNVMSNSLLFLIFYNIPNCMFY